MRTRSGPVLALGLVLLVRSAAGATIEDKTKGLQRIDGFVPLYWDGQGGKLFMEVPVFDADILYTPSLPWGVGSNDIGLDRGQLGEPRVVRFERSGQKVLLVVRNLEYRAEGAAPAEARAVEESFARSALWGFAVEAETGGRVLVDATAFALRDAHGVVRRLKDSEQGSYRVDEARSALYLPRTKGFPDNTEIEATLTFTTTDNPGAFLRSVTPSPEAVTVRVHQSFVRLPDRPYSPRPWLPGCGFIPLTYQDYAQPLGESLTRHIVLRHRLEPKPGSTEPVRPIIYYVDRGAPEPIRTALLEGAGWWSQAFEAAGFHNAFRVEVLPEDADPMDVRYNVVEWVHRSTRGWSYGNALADPRSGEILKGHVTLGSLRVRQDYLIGEALLAPYPTGTEGAPQVEAMALARLRQLAAHEVGHSIGLAHNFIASAEGRASVMDYPHPLLELRKDGTLETKDAYARGIGAWDKVAIGYGYGGIPAGEGEASFLSRVLSEARARGLTFVTDEDARPPGGAHPQAHLWDNGKDATAELERVLLVRRAALERFGESCLRRGRPLASMEEALVPLYLYHRYQAEAAVKLVGGLDYSYALRGDGQEKPRRVPPEAQRRALEVLLTTLDPHTLALPRAVLDSLPPRPPVSSSRAELFPRYTGLVFDAVSPSATASRITLSLLLNPERAARLVEQRSLDPAQLGLDEVLGKVIDAAFGPAPSDGYEAEIHRSVGRVALEGLARLGEAPMPQVRAVVRARFQGLTQSLATPTGDASEDAYRLLAFADVMRFLGRPGPTVQVQAPLEPPPGSPIGSDEIEERF
jgi:hypothetical protein